jgi:hypothetical protein
MVQGVSPGPMGLDPFLIFLKILSNVPDMAPEPLIAVKPLSFRPPFPDGVDCIAR